MKLLLDIADNKAASFMALIKEYSYIKARELSSPDVDLFEEIKEIKKAFKHAQQLKTGKLKSRPVEELLDEL